jgi:hypothetical protein
MKKLTIIFIFLTTILSSQNLQDTSRTKIVRNFFSFIPANVDKINGLSFGAWAANFRSHKDSLKINGINLEINPVMLFIYARGAVYIPVDNDSDSAFLETRKNNIADIDGLNISIPGFANMDSRTNGLSINLLTICAGEINGISLSSITNCNYNLNGISICGIYNSSNNLKGLQIGLFNNANKVSGVQFGLFNKSKKLRGFQFGLWNKNGKRSLPIINWQFRD